MNLNQKFPPLIKKVVMYKSQGFNATVCYPDRRSNVENQEFASMYSSTHLYVIGVKVLDTEKTVRRRTRWRQRILRLSPHGDGTSSFVARLTAPVSRPSTPDSRRQNLVLCRTTHGGGTSYFVARLTVAEPRHSSFDSRRRNLVLRRPTHGGAAEPRPSSFDSRWRYCKIPQLASVPGG